MNPQQRTAAKRGRDRRFHLEDLPPDTRDLANARPPAECIPDQVLHSFCEPACMPAILHDRPSTWHMCQEMLVHLNHSLASGA